MGAVVRSVANVVRQVRRARRGAVRDEGDEASSQRLVVADLAREQHAREQEEVLRPLAGAQRDERGAPAERGAATAVTAIGVRIAQRRGPEVYQRWAHGQPRSNRLPAPSSLSSSIRPPSATASSRAIARPSPVPPPSRDQNGRKIRSRSDGLIPGPGVGDRDGDGAVRGRERQLDPAAVGRPAEGVREQVGDDLQHPVAVGDDHRRAVAVAR